MRVGRYVALFLLLAATRAAAFPDHVLVTTSDYTRGSLAAVQPSPPWPSITGLEPVGRHAVARHALGKHWIVNGSPEDEVQAIDPDTWETVLRIPTGAGSDPHDILVIDAHKAYVSRHDHTHLLIVDPATGAPTDSIDLSPFADADGVPDMSRLESGGARVYVQIQRLNDSARGPVAPSYLAVIDPVTDELVDVDPVATGTQAIELTGLFPVNDMQLEGDRLYVMEQGETEMIDSSGGIDAIDIVALRSLGFVTTEAQLGAHTDAFVLATPSKGYAVTHTDWTLSSHLTLFSRADGSWLKEVLCTVEAHTDQIALDPARGVLFFPDNSAGDPGLRVVDVATDSVLTAAAIDTGLPPRDVLVVAGTTPTGVTGAGEGLRRAARFLPARPNPFRNGTEFRFVLERSGLVDLCVVNAAGRLVRRIAGHTTKRAGEHVVPWDGRDGCGRPVGSGVYFVRLSTSGQVATQRVVGIR